MYRFQIGGICPNLALLLLVSWSLLRGLREGLVLALAAGFMLDALSGGPFGAMTVALVLVAWLSGLGETNVFRTVRILPVIVMAVAMLAYYGALLVILRMSGRLIAWNLTLVRVVAPDIALNLILMPLVYLGMRWLASHFGPKSVEWM